MQRKSRRKPPFSRPPIPYRAGWRFSAQQHIPPVINWLAIPHLAPCNEQAMLRERIRESRRVEPLERCFLHPALPGEQLPGKLALEVVRPLKTGHRQMSQVFVAKILRGKLQFPPPPSSNPEGKGDEGQVKFVVAKVYDPLYISDDGGYDDPFRIADEDYGHEVYSYNNLAECQGSLVPQFYGSYTVDVPVPNRWHQYAGAKRSVRMVLVQYIPGITMYDALKHKETLDLFSQTERKVVMKKVVDFEKMLARKAMWLSDFYPRNVMIVPPKSSTTSTTSTTVNDGAGDRTRESGEPDVRVVFIDLAGMRYAALGETAAKAFPRHVCEPIHQFRDWIDWDYGKWAIAQWGNKSKKSKSSQPRRPPTPESLASSSPASSRSSRSLLPSESDAGFDSPPSSSSTNNDHHSNSNSNNSNSSPLPLVMSPKMFTDPHSPCESHIQSFPLSYW